MDRSIPASASHTQQTPAGPAIAPMPPLRSGVPSRKQFATGQRNRTQRIRRTFSGEWIQVASISIDNHKVTGWFGVDGGKTPHWNSVFSATLFGRLDRLVKH